jgi:sucrose phosphorylase
MAGVPGIYIHSLLGSGNWKDGVSITGVNRTINREKLAYDALESDLDKPSNLRHLIFEGYSRMLKARKNHSAFHQSAPQEILDLGPGVFSLLRTSFDNEAVLCLQSVKGKTQNLTLPKNLSANASYVDLITGRTVQFEGDSIEINSWEVLWLAAE